MELKRILLITLAALAICNCAMSVNVNANITSLEAKAVNDRDIRVREAWKLRCDLQVKPKEVEIVEAAPVYDVPLDAELQQYIIRTCEQYDLRPELIIGQIGVESEYHDGVIGDHGHSFGLMQIQPRWWSDTMKSLGVHELLVPEENVLTGCAIMRYLIDTYGSEYRALQAYNTGSPNTHNGYADKVLARASKL